VKRWLGGVQSGCIMARTTGMTAHMCVLQAGADHTKVTTGQGRQGMANMCVPATSPQP
jgi:hypothetical protein